MRKSVQQVYVDHIIREVDSIQTLIQELQSLTHSLDNYEFERVSMNEIRKHLEIANFGLERLRNAV